jgi:hypothetical protein
LESPACQASLPTAKWPAIGLDTPASTSRTQGSSKKGKLTSAEGSQRKLNAFFALANANKKKAAIPSTSVNPCAGVQDTVKDLTAVIAMPPSPPHPNRLLTSALCLGAKDRTGPPSLGVTATDKTPAASFSTLTPLGKKRGMSLTSSSQPPTDGTRKVASGKKTNPLTYSWTSRINHDLDMGEGEEMEIELPTVKVYPKSSKSANKPSLSKRKSARNSSVGFSPSKPKQIQLVGPEDAPPAPKLDHSYKTILTALVRIKKVKDALDHFITKMTNTLTFLRTHVDPTMAILPNQVTLTMTTLSTNFPSPLWYFC